MKRRNALIASTVAILAAGALFAPAAVAGNSVAWSVSIGGPGFGIVAGQPAVGAGYYAAPPYRPYYRPAYRPVYVAPPVVVRPAPIVYRPIVVPTRRYVVTPTRYAPRAYVPVPARPIQYSVGSGYRY